MKISDAIKTITTEKILKRTPSGRPITEYAVNALSAAIEDEKNWENNAIKCLNCGIINSSLLMPEGCINCNGHDLTLDI